MNRLIAIYLLLGSLLPALAAQDPGIEPIGKMSVALIYATDGKAESAGENAKPLEEKQLKELRSVKEMNFSEYRLIGVDTPKILKGYESWATPLSPSKEILVSFQPIRREGDDRLQIVLEYWQSKRKIFSTNPTLTQGKTLYLVGPEWRDGRLIIAVKILSLDKK